MKEGPDLKNYLDQRLSVKLNGKRHVSGVLRGFDEFLNLVLEDSVDEKRRSAGLEEWQLGTVLVRGNSIVSFETVAALS